MADGIGKGGMDQRVIGIGKWLGFCAGLGLVFTFLGVYDTGRNPFAFSWGLWTLTMMIGWGAAGIVTPLIFDRELAGSRPVFQIPIAAALISLPITFALIMLDWALTRTLMPASFWPTQFFYVFVISLAFTLVNFLIQSGRSAALVREAAAGSAPADAFRQRLPLKYRQAEIWAVSSEDHYLRVHTSAGEHLLLMRLADAMALLAEIEGLQTHRSWWVARAGLSDARRDGQKIVLTLKSGTEAPVSRANIAAVRAAGWV